MTDVTDNIEIEMKNLYGHSRDFENKTLYFLGSNVTKSSSKTTKMMAIII